ncbi:MAG: DMT family transporter [Pseudomonadota bacterium]|nr:DMT family transporter [Pseudomonadota bacterium]
MTSTKRKYVLGFLLSLTTASLWGVLPVALKELLVALDATTIVWYRFFVAAVILLVWLGYRKEIPDLSAVSWHIRWFLIIAAIGLCSNYFLFNYSLNFINGETAEVVMQLTTLFLILGGVIFYKEPFIGIQKVGAGLIIVGLALFFNDRLLEMVSLDTSENFGVLIVFFSALTWTIYALLQKKLLQSYTAAQILFVIYVFSFLVLLPFVTIASDSIIGLTTFQMSLLGFCCLNTIVAYGCFAEALKIWDASKVSAVLALAPLFTIGSLKLMVYFYPDYEFSDRLSNLSLIGALLLIIGSILMALIPLIYQGSQDSTLASPVKANSTLRASDGS